MKTKKFLSAFFLIAFTAAAVYAQKESSSGDVKFIVTGDAYTGLKYVGNVSGTTNTDKFTYTTTGVNPVFLWQVSDKTFFEGEVEFQNRGFNAEGAWFAVGEGLEVELEFCNIGFILGKNTMLRAGTFFSSMGLFEDLYHQRITNKMLSRPLGIGHGGLESGTEMGLNLRGVFPISDLSTLKYSIDFTNGPVLVTEAEGDFTDSVTALKAIKAAGGQLEYELITDKRIPKAFGGRIGFMPSAQSGLEIGASFKTAIVGARYTNDSAIGSTYIGGDFSYVKDIEEIKGTLTFRSQYAGLTVDKADYSYSWTTTDTAGTHNHTAKTTFDNKSSAYYLQLSYRPTMAHGKVLKKMELTGRLCSQTIPDGTRWASDPPSSRTYGNKSQFGITLSYWVTWNAVVKLAYEQNTYQDYKKNADGTSNAAPGYFLQMAMGF